MLSITFGNAVTNVLESRVVWALTSALFAIFGAVLMYTHDSYGIIAMPDIPLAIFISS